MTGCLLVETIGEYCDLRIWIILLQFQSGCQAHNTTAQDAKMHFEYL